MSPTTEETPRVISPDSSSVHSAEISPSAVEQAVEYFGIIRNTSLDFVVELRRGAAESWSLALPWQLLESVSSTTWNNVIYREGDIIYVRTGAEKTAVEIFEIADIRNLGDSRSAFRGFWYYGRPELARDLRSTDYCEGGRSAIHTSRARIWTLSCGIVRPATYATVISSVFYRIKSAICPEALDQSRHKVRPASPGL